MTAQDNTFETIPFKLDHINTVNSNAYIDSELNTVEKPRPGLSGYCLEVNTKDDLEVCH